jgi:polyhydroxyalkanoate synthesis regulator protein
MGKAKRKFVKYVNRKLHEAGEDNSYVTMEELLVIVAKGDEVEITDDQTGEDITCFVLARLIYDRCRMDKRAYNVDALRKILMSNPPPKRDEEDAA